MKQLTTFVMTAMFFISLTAGEERDSAGNLPDLEELSTKLFRSKDPAKATVANFCLVKRYGTQGLPLLTECPKVKTVVLFPNDMKLAAKDLDALESLPKLEKLSLQGVDNLGDDGLKSISEFETLTSLYLRGGGYSKDGLEHLVSMPALQKLTLRSSEVGPADVFRFTLARPDITVSASFEDRGTHRDFDMTVPELLGRQKPPVVTAELNESMQARFRKVDTNNDRWVSHKEYKSAGKNPPNAVRLAFIHAIRPFDDKIQFWDYVSMRQEIDQARNSFGRIDADEDGHVTESEVAEFLPESARDLAPQIFHVISPKGRPLNLHGFLIGWTRALTRHRSQTGN